MLGLRFSICNRGMWSDSMAVRIADNSYSEADIRLLRLARQEGRDDVKDLTITIHLEGDFAASFVQGDNRKILPGDSLKNTVYALARQHSMETSEDFALHLIDHLLTYNAQISLMRIETVENAWARLPHGGKPHPSAFGRAGLEQRTAVLIATREHTSVRSGVQNLAVLKTSNVAFENFLRDPYTTLQPDRNRVLATIIQADWLYANDLAEFGSLWHGVKQMLLETFAEHKSKSLQQTLYTMGEAVLANFDNINEIHLALPEKLFDAVDLTPLGMDNPGTVYLPLEQPRGVVEAILKRSGT